MPRPSLPSVVHRTTGRILRVAEHSISGVIAVLASSPLEEDFFRTGEAMSAAAATAKPERHDFSDLDEGYRRPSLWRVLRGWLRGERTRRAD